MKITRLLKIIGPGQLFASIAIGTSHLVLSTRAGAHYGMIFFWIILLIQLLKYPFFEFGARYTNATGQTLLKGFHDQGQWAVILFLAVISVNMFAVTGAVGAVSAGLLGTLFELNGIRMPFLLGGIMSVTVIVLLLGRYAMLDKIIKIVSVLLFVTVSISFCAALVKGPVQPVVALPPATDLLKGTGLALLVSLIGFMPTGLEVTVMHSIWTVENSRTTGLRPTLREALFDFNLGYLFTTFLALMFMTIGAFTLYGTGQTLEGNSTQFSQKLVAVFSLHIGGWVRPVLALAAFGTIYGTLLTAWDGFARSFAGGIQIVCSRKNDDGREPSGKLYSVVLTAIGIGGYLLVLQFPGGMIKILEAATITVFCTAPVLAFLSLRTIGSPSVPYTHRPGRALFWLAYTGLAAMTLFTLYYLGDLILP